MAVPITSGFRTALSSRKRQMRVQGSIGNLADDSERYALENIISGEVVIDWSQNLDGPVHTATLSVADPNRELFPDLSQGDSGNIWFSCRLRLSYGLKLDSGWEDIPIFAGPIVEMTRDGESLAITAVGKETLQQPPYAFPHSWQVDAGTKYSQAIYDLLVHRGVDEGTLDDIVIASDDPVTHRNFHYGLSQSPWRVLQSFAKHLDKQLFYRGKSPILRGWPSSPVWAFVKGADSIVLQWPEQRLSMTDFFNQAYVYSDKIVNDGPLSGTRAEPVVGFAELADADPLSVATLVAGNKPQMRVWERHAESHARADQIALQYLDGGATGLDAEVTVTCLPLPHLEPMDIVKLDFGTQGVDLHSFRIKNFSIPLTPDGTMELNWQGSRVPRHRAEHRGHHGIHNRGHHHR